MEETTTEHKAAGAPMVPRKCLDTEEHREHVCQTFSATGLYPAMVAKKVPRSQWNTPEAKAALDKEWSKLCSHKWPNGKGVGTWDESRVTEASTVRETAKKAGKSVHFGRIAELLYEKGVNCQKGTQIEH